MLFGLAQPAAAQGCGGYYSGAAYSRAYDSGAYYPALSPPYNQLDAGGLVYYYDRAGYPLYYDDYVHYNYPRRFLYRDGGWVLVSGGHGRYGGYRAANYGHAGFGHGVHRDPAYWAYSGTHYGGYSTRHSGGYRTGHYGSHAGSHAGGRGGAHHGGGRGHR